MKRASTKIELRDMDAWAVFAHANRDALIEHYRTIDNALAHATQGGLVLGGGAAPLIEVFFNDDPPT
jgi:hypothetical protein